MAYNQYTKCVTPADYSGPFLGSAAFWAALTASILVGFFDIGATFLGLIITGIAYCRWWLYGRLVCLDGNQCFIGLAMRVDTAKDQAGIGKLDTDYSVYLLPAPSPLMGDADWLQDLPATNDIQGYLLEDPSPSNAAFAQMKSDYSLTFTGEPVSSYDLVDHDGTTVLTAPQASALNLPTPPDWRANFFYTPGDQSKDSNGNLQTCTPYSQGLSGAAAPVWGTTVGAMVFDGAVQWSCDGPVPVLTTLEVEFEGAGVFTLYQALLAASTVAAMATGACAIPAIGWIVCAILIAIALAITGIGAGIALSDTSAESEADSQVGAITAGQDVLFVLGTWVYDSGHQGWNELHPVLFCQRIDTVPQDDLLQGKPWQSLPQYNEANLKTTIAGWCGLAQGALDPTTVILQSLPQNGWSIHPLVDGCTPLPVIS